MAAARAAKSLPKKLPLPGVKQILLVASGKGGVGKSTVAVNVALGLAERRPEAQVGILDADVFGPSIPRMMNLSGGPDVAPNGLMEPLRNLGLKVMSMGFLAAEDEAVAWRGLRVMQAVEALLRKVSWGPLDYLVVDMPPGTGDVQLTVTQHVPVAGAVVVSTPQLVALADARKAIAMFRDVQVPILGLVENMGALRCGSCGAPSRVFGDDAALKALAKDTGVSVLGSVPLDPSIAADMDEGRPVLLSRPDSEPAAEYLRIAEGVLGNLPDYVPPEEKPRREIRQIKPQS